MRYLSVCSGIEAATVAWHPLGWQPVGFAEIEKFPAAVLATHYPDVPNFGDMTKFKEWPDVRPDVLVGGTPCQSFSVAGLRKGMADPRGSLALTYLAIADQYRPEWLLWENVPGVLSSNGGRDFGAFLGGMVELGYGFAYRMLDAQYVRVDGFGRAVPQRRRRVFVVGNSRDWRRAAAVLFERESLSWNSAPRRQAGQRVAPTISARPTGGGGFGTDFDLDGGLLAYGGGNTSGPIAFDTTQITSKANRSVPKAGDPCHPLAEGAHPPAIAFDCKASGQSGFGVGDVASTMRAMGHHNTYQNGGGHQAVAYGIRNDASRNGEAKTPSADADGRVRLRNAGLGVYAELAPTIDAGTAHTVATSWAVRRLTPTECERLQGFPDGYTNVPWRGKDRSPDGPRYKACGNSMAVNAMRWLGTRIAMVNEMSAQPTSAISSNDGTGGAA